MASFLPNFWWFLFFLESEVELEKCFFCSILGELKLKGWLAIAKLIPLSLFIPLLLMPNEAFDNVKIEK